MKEFHTYLLYTILGIVVGATAFNTVVPMHSIIITGIAVCLAIIITIVTGETRFKRASAEKETTKLVVPFLIIGGFVVSSTIVINSILSHICDDITAVVLSTLSVAILCSLFGVLYALFKNYINNNP